MSHPYHEMGGGRLIATPGFSASAQGYGHGFWGFGPEVNPFDHGTIKAKNWEKNRKIGAARFQARVDAMIAGLE